MIRLPRFALVGFTLAFGLYHAVLGVLNLGVYDNSSLAMIAIGLYLVALLVSVLDRPGLELSRKYAHLNLLVAILVPILMASSIHFHPIEGYATWHVAGIATLMAVTAVRQHRAIAWLGVSFSVLEVLLWGGLGIFFTSGIIGALMLVTAAHASSNALRSSVNAANEYREMELSNTAASMAKTAARKERQERVALALKTSLPFLEAVVAKKGKLTASEKAQALVIEANLRDQIRGRMLLTERLEAEVLAARQRGVEVQLLDDGGLNSVEDDLRLELLERVTEELSKVQSGKVVIRAVPNEQWKITMAAIRKESDRPDLFIRL